MRSPAATRLLALPRFFRFFTGLPPLVGLCGASVMCETNCFSVGNMLKSVPYSLITNCTVSTPMASIPVRSTPLMRYSAWRRGSSPRFLIACAFRLAQFRRRLPAALFPLHLCQLRHDLPLILRDALLDGVVHLQGLPQSKQVVRTPMPAQLLVDGLLALVASPIPQLGQPPGVPLSPHDGPHDGHPGHPIDIRYRPVHAYIHLIQARLFCIRRSQSPVSATRMALSRTRVRSMHTCSSGRNEPSSSPQLCNR